MVRLRVDVTGLVVVDGRDVVVDVEGLVVLSETVVLNLTVEMKVVVGLVVLDDTVVVNLTVEVVGFADVVDVKVDMEVKFVNGLDVVVWVLGGRAVVLIVGFKESVKRVGFGVVTVVDTVIVVLVVELSFSFV